MNGNKSCLTIFLFLLGMSVSIFGEQVSIQRNQAVAKELFGYARKFKGVTQSHTHMNNKYVQKQLMRTWGLSRNKGIIKSALTKELEMAKQGYVVFYTAVPYMRMFQDIARKVHKAVIGKVGALQEKGFQFIRYAYGDPRYMQYKNAKDFLVKEIEREGIINDNIVRQKTILASTNLAFFGNIGFSGESTYYYFNKPQPWASANVEWLKSLLRTYGYSTDYVDDLMKLIRGTVTKTGDLFQIFVPKEMINDIGYLSWRQGIPFDEGFLKNMFTGKAVRIRNRKGKVVKEFVRNTMRFDRSDALFHAEINERIAEYKEKYRAGDKEALNTSKYLMLNAKLGKYHLMPFLDQYKMGKLPYMNYYQARLLVGPWFFDPTKGLKIYRYSTLDSAREQAYKKKLKEIFNKMELQRKQRLGILESGA